MALGKTLYAKLKLQLTFGYSKVMDNSTAKDSSVYTYDVQFGSTSGLDFDASSMWHDQRLVSAASPNDDIDFAGVIEDVFGDVITAAKVKAILIVNLSESTGDRLLVGGAGSGGDAIASMFDGDQDAVVAVGPGSPLIVSDLEDGFTVTAGSGDVLRVAYDGSSDEIRYDIFVFFA